MKAPNFFLLGAPKCATTSLYDQLSRHSQIYCPRTKEPGFYTRDDVQEPYRSSIPHLQSIEKYLDLFKEAKGHHRVRCDGSTSYLGDETALVQIKKTIPNAKALAVVRDPVHLISSYHVFLVHEGWEHIDDLKEAWRRTSSDELSGGARRRRSLVYRDVAMLGRQIERAKEIFKEDLMVATLNDLVIDLPSVLNSTFEFIGVDEEDLGELPVLNPARKPRNIFLNKLIKNPPKSVANLRDILKKSIGRPSLGLRKKIETINAVKVDRSIDEELVSEMRRYFTQDVERLSGVLKRDLRAEWKWS